MSSYDVSPSLSPLPPNVDPGTYRVDEVSRLLERASYLSIFSVHNPALPNVPIPSPTNPNALIGVEVHEDLHRFDVEVEPPMVESGLCARKHVGESVARVQIRWTVIPDDFEAAPGLLPPPTELDPTRSQRFAMLNGQMTWLDRLGSGFRAFGAGRTFPVMVGNTPQLRIGAVINVLEGFGRFQGLPGTICVNGYITPPQALALNFVLRFADPDGKLRSSSPVTPLKEIADPDPDTVFLMFLGEMDPARPLRIEPTSSGVHAWVYQKLRLVRISFDLGGERGVRSRTSGGPIVGTLSSKLMFNPLDPNPVTPLRGSEGAYTFFDRQGRTVATLSADVIEGRAFQTVLPGAPGPVFRFGGFGPFRGGTGPLEGAIGMMSVNAAISLFPGTVSAVHVLRVSDPDGRFRAACSQAWS
jgi:hypothetical protein